MNEGHCGLPVEELTALAGKLLEVPTTYQNGIGSGA